MNRSRNAAILVASFLASLPLWTGLNIANSKLESALFWTVLAQNPEYFSASVIPAGLTSKTLIREKKTPPFELSARSALSLHVDAQGNASVLFEKESSAPFPVASLTKLMTALVAQDHYEPGQDIAITIEAVLKEEDTGNLKVGEVLDAKNLLASLLIESSNDAAVALGQVMGQELFLRFVNEKASDLGLINSSFSDIAGVDPNQQEKPLNTMSAQDVATLAAFIIETHPDLARLLKEKRVDIYNAQGTFHHSATNTNALLWDQSFSLPIVMGKTGWTPASRGCLLLVTQSKDGQGYLINVILGSEDRFFDMKRLIQWVSQEHDF